MKKLQNEKGETFEIHGFCPVDVPQIWEVEKLNTFRFLQGDFFIKIFSENKVIYITDFAGTYSSHTAPRNHTLVFENNQITHFQQNWETSEKFYEYPTGWKKKHNLDDFIEAVDTSVKLRCTDNPTITMSCGHDSGTIVASALKQKLEFETLSVLETEYKDTLMKRVEKTNGKIVTGLKKGGGNEFLVNYIESSVVLTGLGADELYSCADDELLSLFFSKNQTLYQKYGIQLRFPLSDYNVWKEYFSLHKVYREMIRNPKAPFVKYMKQENFPIYFGKKLWFGI